MKVHYDRPRGGRVKKSKFLGFTCYDHPWWFSYVDGNWHDTELPKGHSGSSHQPCKSVASFRRKLKNAPKGVEFTLESRYVGHNVIGYGSKEEKS